MPSHYKDNATRYTNLDKYKKETFNVDNTKYQVDIQLFTQWFSLIGELRAKGVESLYENHRKFIFGLMTCWEILRQIKDSLEPAEDFQRLRIIDEYSKNSHNTQQLKRWWMVNGMGEIRHNDQRYKSYRFQRLQIDLRVLFLQRILSNQSG